MKNANTVEELRNHYVEFGGFTGGWDLLLEGFKEVQSRPKIAVSEPVCTDSWIIDHLNGLGREVELGGGMAVVVIDDWDALVRRVNVDALRERFLAKTRKNQNKKRKQP